eukprot:2841672-Amphidinium_carterae.1
MSDVSDPTNQAVGGCLSSAPRMAVKMPKASNNFVKPSSVRDVLWPFLRPTGRFWKIRAGKQNCTAELTKAPHIPITTE